MQRIKAVRVFVIGTAMLCACNATKSGDEPMRIPTTSGVTAGNVYTLTVGAPTALPTPETAKPTTPSPTPTEIAKPPTPHLTETIKLAKDEKIAYVNGDMLAIVTGETYNKAMPGGIAENLPPVCGTGVCFKDAPSVKEYHTKNILDYWARVYNAAHGTDITPDEVTARLANEGLSVPTTKIIKNDKGDYVYERQTVTQPGIVLHLVGEGELGSKGLYLGHRIDTNTSYRVELGVEKGTLNVTVEYDPKILGTAKDGRSDTTDILGNADLALEAISFMVKGGNEQTLIGTGMGNFAQTVDLLAATKKDILRQRVTKDAKLNGSVPLVGLPQTKKH